MAILKKVKGSTLMETLVATVLIVIVFMLASMILNSLFSNVVKSNTKNIEAHLNELQYLYQNNKLSMPYKEDHNQWLISVTRFIENDQTIIEFEAVNNNTKKTIIKRDFDKK